MNKINKDFMRGVIAAAVAAAFLSLPLFGFGALPKLNPIKPPASVKNQTLTDEQQGILAVRNTKPSVVNIIGSSSLDPAATSTLSGKLFSSISGSGIIVDPDGYIVSNNHVVQDATLSYTVMFADGSQYPAIIVGLDKYDDIALLKIDVHGLPAARLGDSDSLETGQTVFAIGDSLGKYQNTVTRGVVSGLGRAINVGSLAGPVPRLQNLIQTDAAINPGNSGGPLINMAGEVVGMNTLIDSAGAGLGFAIPVNVIKNVMGQLKTNGKISKPYMGLSFVTINKSVQAENNLVSSQGALVREVAQGGPAALAGIVEWDIVTAINHEKLTASNEFDSVVGKYRPGTQLLITLLRSGQQLELPIILGEFK